MRKVIRIASIQEDKCKKAPCQVSCPAGVNIPVYIGLIGEKDFLQAYKAIRTEIPFPSVCARVCNHPCESACRRVGRDEALAIRALKRVPGDYLFLNGGLPKSPKKTLNANKVAVVGSGPAGLSAAFYLAQKGYAVTVFESMPKPGGMMMYGIPDYRLPKDVLCEEVNVIKDCGVNIKNGVRVGKDITIQKIFEDGFEAIFLAVGASVGNKMNIAGEELSDVFVGVDFLKNVNSGIKYDFKGKKVAIIGAGNVAADASRSALRFGADKIDVYYRRSKKDMPVTDEELAQMEHEGINIHTMVAPVKVINKNDKVIGIELIKMKAGKLDSSGRYSPIEIEGSNYKVDADIVISAIGYHPDASQIDERLNTTKWGSVAVNITTMATSIEKVFSGGDCVSGATTVVEAIAEGKRAAVIIDKMFGANGELAELEKAQICIRDSFASNEQNGHREQERMLKHIDDFCEINLGYSIDMALAEAKRCLHCDLVCNTCENVCPVLSAKAKKPGLRKIACIDEDRCTGCAMCEQRCPDQAIVMVDLDKPKITDMKIPDTLVDDIKALCHKAHMLPDQVICYCYRVKASEVAAAILSGAKTPEEVALLTGARTGCGVLCANSTMRQFEAAGIKLDKAPGYQWYGCVPTIWKIPDSVMEKYDKEYRLFSDRDKMDKLFPKK